MGELWRLEPGDYKGLRMRCAPGTHEAAMALVRRHVRPAAAVLDVASGAGAFLLRLRDHGFDDLSALELDAPKFQCPGVTPMAIDLEADFAAALPKRYDLVSAIEIIEHLEKPHHFLRQLRECLTDGGHLVLSTPNVSNWVGRIKFLLTGKLRYFDEGQYRYNHHVSPIPHTQMTLMLAEVGFELVEHVTAGSFFGPAKRAALWPADRLARLALGAGATGDVNLYLARRTVAPPPRRPEDWTATAGD